MCMKERKNGNRLKEEAEAKIWELEEQLAVLNNSLSHPPSRVKYEEHADSKGGSHFHKQQIDKMEE